jgi:hypothetical protein
VVPRLVIRRWQELQEGGRLTVGKVTLTKDAVECESFWGKRRSLPLADIRDFRSGENQGDATNAQRRENRLDVGR